MAAATQGSSQSTVFLASSHDTALCVIPPKSLWPPVDRLRMLYDKAYEKWPPHINVVYPFVGVNSLSSASELILSESKGWKQDSGDSKLLVRLDRADVFSHRHDNTIFLCDDNQAHLAGLAALRGRILGALGRSPDGYQMHMTIGQSDDLNSSSHKFLLEKASLLPAIEWDVGELHILVRERSQIDGSATSQMKLWGTIDLTTLSIRQMDEPIPVREAETSAQVIDAESDATTSTGPLSRTPYAYSAADEKWKPSSLSSPPDVEDSLPPSLTIASYNVLAEFEYPPLHDRYPLIMQNLLDKSAVSDVLVLEEVTDDFLSYILRDDGIREAYQFVSCGPPDQPDLEPLPSHLNTVVLSKWPFTWDWMTFRRRHKGSVIVRFDNIGKHIEAGFLPIILSTIHLSRGLTDGAVASKKLELQAILEHLSVFYPQNPWILAGDFNITTSTYTVDAALKRKAISSQTATYLTAIETMLSRVGLVDAWSYARVQYGDSSFDQDQKRLSEAFEGEEGATFDPTVNEIAANSVGSGLNNRPQRYDRILVKAEDVSTVSGFNMFGKVKGLLGHGDVAQGQVLSYGSDHWGIRCLLKFTPRASVEPTDKNNSNGEFVVPVELKTAPGALEDTSQLWECLRERNVFPTEEDINRREAALSILKETILEDDGTGSSGHVRGKPTFVLVPVGSYGLGVWAPSSDLDCLCIGPISPRTFFTLAVQRLRKAAFATRGGGANNSIKILRRVKAHSGTMLELEVLGIKTDLHYCPAALIAETWPHAVMMRVSRLPPTDPVSFFSSLSVQTLAKLKPARDLYHLRRTVPDFAAFRVAYACIRCWAKQRGIYAARFGYLGGIHIALLLSRVCKLLTLSDVNDGGGGGGTPVSVSVSVPNILTTFFDHYARFDWAAYAAFDPFFFFFDGRRRPRLRYVRTAREPLAILGCYAPGLNVAVAATRPSVRTLSEELKRASALLLSSNYDGGMTWNKFLGEVSASSAAAEFLTAHKTYVRIDAQFWGVSLAKGSGFVGWLESRCVMLLVDVSRRLPDIHARIWPARFTERETTDEDHDYQGSYLIGLDRLDSQADKSVAKDEVKQTMGTLRTVLEKFEGQIRGDEKHFDSTSCWMSASLAKQSEARNMRLDTRDWGEYTIGDDESEDEEDEDEDPEEDLDNDAETTTSKKKKRSVPDTLPSRPVYTGKFRTSADVINRLRWDPEMDSGDYVVGYEDRFLGIMERALDQWKTEQTDEEFIPQHRIEYFKRSSDGVVVWDRKQRKDGIFGSGVSSLPPQQGPS